MARLRAVDVKARLLSRDGRDLGVTLILLECQITGDWSNDDGIPVGARLTFVDPKGRIRVLPRNTRKGIWFSHQISIRYGIWVPELERYVYTDEFYGPVDTVGRQGIVVEVDALSKELQHSGEKDDGYVLVRSWTARKNWPVWRAIQRLFKERGETRFAMASSSRRMHKSRTWQIGAPPMGIARRLVQVLDSFIVYFRADGKLALRKRRTAPVWAFGEGETSLLIDRTSIRLSRGSRSHDTVVFQGTKIVREPRRSFTSMSSSRNAGATTINVVDVKGTFGNGKKVVIGKGTIRQESRTITDIAGNTLTLKRALSKDHPKGEKAIVHHVVKRRVPIYERAKLAKGHSLSSETISDGKRPNALILRNSNIHKRSRLEGRAHSVIKREGRIESDVPIRSAMVPGLELLDVLAVRAGGVNTSVTTERFIKDLVAHTLETNWQGRRIPRKGKR